MDAIRGEEEGEQESLEGSEGDVGRDEEGGGGTRGKDARPEVLHKRAHNFGLRAIAASCGERLETWGHRKRLWGRGTVE